VINKLIALLLVLFTLSASAGPAVVHTNGEAHTRLLAKLFFSDLPVVASPGADGLLVWKKLEGNKTDVAIQPALAVHFLPTLHAQEDFAGKHELLATLATAPQALAVRPDFPVDSIQDVKRLGRPLTVGWVGHACKSLLTEVFAKNSVEFVYVAYKTPQEATGAMLGGHIDATCPAAAALKQAVQNKTGKVIFDITGYHGFTLTTSLFVNKGMPEATKKSILQQLARPLTTEDISVAEANGFTLNVQTGKQTIETFNKDRKIWQRITQLN
jgi:tripartite-type tricarboxylate transporter receptor subunit TctC